MANSLTTYYKKFREPEFDENGKLKYVSLYIESISVWRRRRRKRNVSPCRSPKDY